MATPAITRRPVRTVAITWRPVRTATAERVWAAACAAGFALLCAALHRFVTDDAYITARYAENLAAGAGFTFNPGGPRVEGYSNPLLVSLEAFGATFGLPAIAVARAAGVASGLGLLAVIHATGPAALGRAASRAALVAGTALAVLPWLRPEGLMVALAVAVAAEAPGALRGRRIALERLALV